MSMPKKPDQGLLEAILFATGKPITYKELAKLSKSDEVAIKKAIAELNQSYEERGSGLRCSIAHKSVQLFTSPAYDEVIHELLQSEVVGELTKPSVETLSIIAYRGPLSKESLEQIRGVNCTMILRNLLIRGLVEEVKSGGGVQYEVTHDFLRYLGVSDISALPEYEVLRQHEHIEQVVAAEVEEE